MTEKLKTDVSTAAGEILDLIRRHPKQPVIVAIDGRCGSGKTTLAGALQEKDQVAVVHMDDFFLRAEQGTTERLAEPGGNVDRERVLEEVLVPLRKGCPAVYRPYDAHRGVMLEPVQLGPSPVIIVEGSYSCHPKLWDHYDLHIFLDVPPEEQLRRIRLRNGPAGLDMFKSKWIPLEEAYFRAFSPHKCCDLYIELTQPQGTSDCL